MCNAVSYTAHFQKIAPLFLWPWIRPFLTLFVLKTPFWCAHCFWHHQIRYKTCVTCPSYNLLYRVLKRWPMVSKSGFWQFNMPCRLKSTLKLFKPCIEILCFIVVSKDSIPTCECVWKNALYRVDCPDTHINDHFS